uniref:RNA-directed DNA polymerase, eukaryota n=1 Tax=Tanacetum cinerariifolium TaxID=118510 RepID=A0A699HYI6_TANCI|nr:RNA-directed DNA polymerase, eukaryota [Tanacetum cinerariifolium]
MGSYRSKKDEVLKIFMSVFVANLPDLFGAKDLWNTCKQYGQVVDAYIPYRRSKAGKRFGFVHFIKVLGVDRLVNNLYTVWAGRHKLQGNIPRFQREVLKRRNSLHNIDGVKRGNLGDTYHSNGVKGAASSYAHVVKGSQNSKMDLDSSPVMVLDDSCLNEKDYSLCLMEVTKLKFQENSVMKTWFSQIQLASSDFNSDGRVTWVEIEDFMEDNDEDEDSKVGSYEEVPNGEDVKNVEDFEGDSYGEIVLDTKFEEDFPNQKGEEDSVGQGNVQSEDPFNIYELLNHKRPVIDKNSNSNESLKYPPGYTPTRSHFKKSEVPKSGGSILQLIDDLVKIGEAIRILCVWDPNMFKKMNSTVLDYFVMVRGYWMPNGKKLLIISVYAPQELFEKNMLWDYLSLVMSKWEGEVVIMGDFNEVRNKSKSAVSILSLLVEVDGFDKFIEDSWKDAPIVESNALVRMMKKLKTEVVNLLQEVEKKNSLEADQKTKIKWAIEGDKNSKYYYDVINKKRNQLSIRGILVEDTWIDSPSLVKIADLECQVSKEEIKKAVWDCGIDKSPGPDGFTFISKILANHLVVVLGGLVNEIQSAFAADKQILDGPFILNELVQWCKKKKKQSLVFKVDFEKAYDSVRWVHLDDIMRKFGFGEKWCVWIQSCLWSSRGLVIVNGNPTEEFQFYKGLKQGDPLSPFLFILFMESLHISFQRVMDVGLFKGIELAPSLNLSHMFYADDAIFMGQWIPKKVFHRMESMRSYFFNGDELSSKKSVWVKWKHALPFKDIGGLAVSSLFALNRALMFKWVWRFITQGSSLWARVIKALHGYDGKIGQKVKSCYPSLWLDIIHEEEMFKSRGVVSKYSNSSNMKEKMKRCILVDMMDRWFWAMEGSSEFTITSVRKMIDDFMLPEVSSKTRWIKAVPIKVNVHAWKVKLDGLPTRLNISRRGIDIESILCPMCGNAVESTSHIFFTCQMSKEILRKISR